MQTEQPLSLSAIFAANRARGAVTFDVHLQDGRTRRRQLHESGSLRVRFPSPEDHGLSAMFVNTAGGAAGGDRFDIDIAAGAGTRLTMSTAAAEKIYRALEPAATIDVKLTVDTGAALAWLPQETILFDRCRLRRSIEVDLADDARLLLSEATVFGRSG
ncbi:MAG: urease accessory protein UreD, partial [Tardiphaga sp.]